MWSINDRIWPRIEAINQIMVEFESEFVFNLNERYRWFATHTTFQNTIIYFLDDGILYVDNVWDPIEVRMTYANIMSRRENPIRNLIDNMHKI